MRTSVLSALIAANLLGCGSVAGSGTGPEDTATSQEALTGTWIGPVSEESTKSWATCASRGLPNTVALGAQCKGSYCDDMYLYCGAPPKGFTLTGVDLGWGAYTSDEYGGGVNYRPSLCNGLGVIDGVRATGSYSDNVAVHCVGANYPDNLHCRWTDPFSEEQPAQYFTGTLFPTKYGAVSNGFRCSGSYCDNNQFWVCEPPCTSDNDCSSGYYCSSTGYCTIG